MRLCRLSNPIPSPSRMDWGRELDRQAENVYNVSMSPPLQWDSSLRETGGPRGAFRGSWNHA